MSEADENGRLYMKLYFDIITSPLYQRIPGDPLKLYFILRRYICRARSGHSLSLFYINGYLAMSGYLGTYAKLFGKSIATISRWIKTLEEHKVLFTYQKGRDDRPSIWILGRVIHVEGSLYGEDVFFLDHLPDAQKKDQQAVATFDDAQMKECETPEHTKLNSTLALLQLRMQTQMQRRMQTSNRKEVIEKTNSKSLSKTAKAPLPNSEEQTTDYTITYHYKDREHVKIIGKAATGPWLINCPSCESIMTISGEDVAHECYCGMHEIVVTKTKPRVKAQRNSEAVETYYGIVKARGVKYGSMEEWHGEITEAVKDVARWGLVVKEYITQTGKNGKPWSALSVDRMLEYYKENRMPGTRKAKSAPGDPPKDQSSWESTHYAPADRQAVGEPGQRWETTLENGKAVVRLVDGDD